MTSLATAVRLVHGGALWSGYELPAAVAKDDFEAALHGLRTTIRETKALLPMPETDAPPNTLSKLHGEGAFPPHIDGAHYTTPPRYVVLFYAKNPECRPTPLYDWATVIEIVEAPAQLYTAPFYYRTGRRSFIDTILSASRQFIRYDPGCMVPATSEATRILRRLQDILANLPPVMPAAQAGNGLVVDNWRALHGRATSVGRDSGRLLYRAWLDE